MIHFTHLFKILFFLFNLQYGYSAAAAVASLEQEQLSTAHVVSASGSKTENVEDNPVVQVDLPLFFKFINAYKFDGITGENPFAIASAVGIDKYVENIKHHGGWHRQSIPYRWLISRARR